MMEYSVLHFVCHLLVGDLAPLNIEEMILPSVMFLYFTPVLPKDKETESKDDSNISDLK